MAKEKGRLAKRALIALAIVVALLGIASIWYVNDYYRASDAANAIVADANGDSDGVVVRYISNKAIAFVPDQPVAGFVFYPGAKVQPEAYAPLMEQCAEHGILCVIVKPLFNLAVLDPNCAEGVCDQFPDISSWAIGGHSMGGIAASRYALRHSGEFASIAFLASYPTANLSNYAGKVVSLTGTNDLILDRDRYNSAFAKLPSDTLKLSIEGGNHAYFGDYGEQTGDGESSITRQEQQEQTASAIVNLIEGEAQ